MSNIRYYCFDINTLDRQCRDIKQNENILMIDIDTNYLISFHPNSQFIQCSNLSVLYTICVDCSPMFHNGIGAHQTIIRIDFWFFWTY